MIFAAVGGVSLRSGCASLRDGPNGNHVNNQQKIHLSEAKRCSDQAGQLNVCVNGDAVHSVRLEIATPPWQALYCATCSKHATI